MKRALVLLLGMAACHPPKALAAAVPTPKPAPSAAKPHSVMILEGPPRPEFRFLKQMLVRSSEWSYRIFVEAPDGNTQWESDSSATKIGPFGSPPTADQDLIVIGDIDPTRLGNPGAFVEYARGGGTIVFVPGLKNNPKKFQGTAWSALLPCESFVEATAPAIFEITDAGQSHPVCRLDADKKKNIEAWRELEAVFWFVRSTRVKIEAQVLAELQFRSPSGGPRISEPLIIGTPLERGKILFLATDEWDKIQSNVTDRSVQTRVWQNIFESSKR